MKVINSQGQIKEIVANYGSDYVLLDSKQASSSATIDFLLTGANAGFAEYVVVFFHVAPATDNVSLLMRTSTDGGSTFDSGASDYRWCRFGYNDSAASGAGGSTGASSITLYISLGNAANETSSGEVTIANPSAAQCGTLWWQISSRNQSGALDGAVGNAQRATAADVDAVRFLMSSGNIASGTFYLYGKRATSQVVNTSNAAAASQAEVDAETVTTKYVSPGAQRQLPGLCGGRLTLTSGVPVTTSDVTGAATIYFTPFIHNRVSLFNGTRWKTYAFTELSLALGTLTSGKNYDVFLYDNSGTLTLELSAAWTNDTTRADALTRQDGVYVKSGATTRLYLGTFRTTSTTTTEDSYGGAHQAGGKRFLWNYYNRALRAIAVKDTTDSWTYSTATWRQTNNNTGNKVEYVVGLSLEVVKASAQAIATQSSSGFFAAGVGVDATNANSAAVYGSSGAGSGALSTLAVYLGFPGIGYHALNQLEIAQAATTTWTGDGGLTYIQSGLTAEVWA